jgi:protease-4
MMGRRLVVFVAAAAALLVACGCINLGPLLAGRIEEVVVQESPRWIEPNRIALVDVSGFIGAGGGLLSAGTTVADVKEKLNRAADDRRVRALLLRVESRGGEASASDTIYNEVLRFRRETGKPVVAMLRGTATSGGYYVALAADTIVAEPTAVTGSVGAIIALINVEGLFSKLGLRPEIVKSGDKKDIGSPMRAMTPEERGILQGIADALFRRFLDTTRARRGEMTGKDLELISDGRILTAEQALELHMVDRLGYLEEAIEEAKYEADIETADVILYRPFPHYNENIYAASPVKGGLLEQGLRALTQQQGPRFLYLWSPGL